MKKQKLYPLGLRVTAEMKNYIDSEAIKNNRTQSQQVEVMIWRALKIKKWIDAGMPDDDDWPLKQRQIDF